MIQQRRRRRGFTRTPRFRRLPQLDYVATNQLAQWFAHHLSNTGFHWPYWAYWKDVADAPPTDRQRLFVARALEVAVYGGGVGVTMA